MTKARGGSGKPAPRDFTIHERKTLSRKFFLFEDLKLTHRRFDGETSRPLSRERLHIGRAVAVLPFDVKRDQVLLIEQFRSGATEFKDGPWLIECVAGIVERGEDIQKAAIRELAEEAGLTCRHIEPAGVYAANPAVTTEFTQCFIADTDLANAGGIHGVVEEDEDIRSLVVPSDEAFAMMEAGQIICANALIPLRFLQVHKSTLQARWQ